MKWSMIGQPRMFHALKQVMHMNALTIWHCSLGQHRGGNCMSHVFTDVAAQDTTAPGLLPELGSLRWGAPPRASQPIADLGHYSDNVTVRKHHRRMP